jgi:hypothetical protein
LDEKSSVFSGERDRDAEHADRVVTRSSNMMRVSVEERGPRNTVMRTRYQTADPRPGIAKSDVPVVEPVAEQHHRHTL